MFLTLRLYPGVYDGLTHFLFSYRLELNRIRLTDMSMKELVVADFFSRWAPKYLLGEKAQWAARPRTKQHNYHLPLPVAFALYELMNEPSQRLVPMLFVAALDQALVDMTARYVVDPAQSEPYLLIEP